MFCLFFCVFSERVLYLWSVYVLASLFIGLQLGWVIRKVAAMPVFVFSFVLLVLVLILHIRGFGSLSRGSS